VALNYLALFARDRMQGYPKDSALAVCVRPPAQVTLKAKWPCAEIALFPTVKRSDPIKIAGERTNGRKLKSYSMHIGTAIVAKSIAR
jgi:hypothetical protein